MGDVLGIKAGGKSRFAPAGPGRTAWLEAVDNVPLSALTPDKAQTWKLAFVGKAGNDEAAARRARNSANNYRANATFQNLTAWLREHGVTDKKPLHTLHTLHTLRKEAGSLVCQRAGLFSASRFLRHADVAITAQHYAAQKDRITVGLGSLLTTSTPANVIEFTQQEPVKASARAAKKRA